MAHLGHAGRQIGVALCEAVGLNPNDVLAIEFRIPNNDVATLTFKVVCTDEAGKVLVENDELKVALRTFTEAKEDDDKS